MVPEPGAIPASWDPEHLRHSSQTLLQPWIPPTESGTVSPRVGVGPGGSYHTIVSVRMVTRGPGAQLLRYFVGPSGCRCMDVTVTTSLELASRESRTSWCVAIFLSVPAPSKNVNKNLFEGKQYYASSRHIMTVSSDQADETRWKKKSYPTNSIDGYGS